MPFPFLNTFPQALHRVLNTVSRPPPSVADVIFAVILATSVSDGGFGYNSATLGIALGSYGAFMFLFTLLFYPFLCRTFGPRLLFTIAFAIFIVLWPALPAFASLTASPDVQWALVLLYVLGRAVAGGTGFSVSLLFVSNAASAGTRGRVTGLSDTFAGLTKAVAPTVAGFVWAFSASQSFPIYPYFASVVLSAFSVIGLVASTFASPALAAPRKGEFE